MKSVATAKAGKKTELVTLSLTVADTVWSIVQFWPPFSQTIFGNRFVQCLDEISITAVQIKKQSKSEKLMNSQKLLMLHKEAMVWLDKARRRRLLTNEEYQKLYLQIKALK